MRASEQIKQFIRDREGLRLKAYQCSAGRWTIGWGHTSGVKQGDVITPAQAVAFFDQDIESLEKSLAKLIKVALIQSQQDALISFCFNVGAPAFERSNLLRCVNAKVFDKAAREFERWSYETHIIDGNIIKTRNNGLLARRQLERAIFERGEYA